MQPLPRNSSFMRSLSCCKLLSVPLAPVHLTGPSSAFLSWLWLGCPEELTAPGSLCHLQHQGTGIFCTRTPCTWIFSGAAAAPVPVPQPVPPCVHLCKPTAMLETKSSPRVPQGSLLTFMVFKRPLHGFVIILRVRRETLT